jgi:hypothetical protein
MVGLGISDHNFGIGTALHEGEEETKHKVEFPEKLSKYPTSQRQTSRKI